MASKRQIRSRNAINKNMILKGLFEGKSASKISKETGISYQRVKQVIAQIMEAESDD